MLKFLLSILSWTLFLASLVSCKTTVSPGRDSAKTKGFIAQSPSGGTLINRDLDTFDCNRFKEAQWYRMSRPVAGIIWHQYLGLRIELLNNKDSQPVQEFETSGLSDPSDLKNFQSWWQEKGSSNKYAHMITSKRYDNCREFLESARRVNEAMATSSYQNAGIRVIAMIITPIPVLGGRPCAREAQAGTETWLNSSPSNEGSESCEHCTEVIPNAKWSETSVDWTPAAFSDAETIDVKSR